MNCTMMHGSTNIMPKSDFKKRQSPNALLLHNEVKLFEPVSNQHIPGAAPWNDPTITVRFQNN